MFQQCIHSSIFLATYKPICYHTLQHFYTEFNVLLDNCDIINSVPLKKIMFQASNCSSCTSSKDHIKANLNFKQASTKWHLSFVAEKKGNMKHKKKV